MLNDYIEVVIDGEPIPQERPRITKKGHVYTHDKCYNYRRYVALEARKAMRDRDFLQGPLAVNLVFFREVPKSWSKTKQQKAVRGEFFPVSRPDLDNYIKAVLDSCNGILYKDDGQIVRVCASKAYSYEPRVVLKVRCMPSSK